MIGNRGCNQAIFHDKKHRRKVLAHRYTLKNGRNWSGAATLRPWKTCHWAKYKQTHHGDSTTSAGDAPKISCSKDSEIARSLISTFVQVSLLPGAKRNSVKSGVTYTSRTKSLSLPIWALIIFGHWAIHCTISSMLQSQPTPLRRSTQLPSDSNADIFCHQQCIRKFRIKCWDFQSAKKLYWISNGRNNKK